MSQLRRHNKRWYRDYPRLLRKFTREAATLTRNRAPRRARALVHDALVEAWLVPWPELERSRQPLALQVKAGLAAMARTVRRHKRERRLEVSIEELAELEREALEREELRELEAA
jgi:hypothetical protein